MTRGIHDSRSSKITNKIYRIINIIIKTIMRILSYPDGIWFGRPMMNSTGFGSRMYWRWIILPNQPERKGNTGCRVSKNRDEAQALLITKTKYRVPSSMQKSRKSRETEVSKWQENENRQLHPFEDVAAGILCILAFDTNA